MGETVPKTDGIDKRSRPGTGLRAEEKIELGVYKPGGRYKKQSMDFFRKCVGEETYWKAVNSEAGRRHHFVVARAFLDQTNWERFVWIEEYGSLDGFPE